MTFRWEEYLDLAKELSSNNEEAAKRSAISRAYYAGYHAARRHGVTGRPGHSGRLSRRGVGSSEAKWMLSTLRIAGEIVSLLSA